MSRQKGWVFLSYSSVLNKLLNPSAKFFITKLLPQYCAPRSIGETYYCVMKKYYDLGTVDSRQISSKVSMMLGIVDLVSLAHLAGLRVVKYET